MGLEATVTSKGQLVIPVGLRRRHYIKAGTRVQFQDVEGGILIRPVTKEYIDRLCGSLAGRGIPDDEEREPDREIE
jgi:AbrB family looped-hinge helix DNA binding protein